MIVKSGDEANTSLLNVVVGPEDPCISASSIHRPAYAVSTVHVCMATLARKQRVSLGSALPARCSRNIPPPDYAEHTHEECETSRVAGRRASLKRRRRHRTPVTKWDIVASERSWDMKHEMEKVSTDHSGSTPNHHMILV